MRIEDFSNGKPLDATLLGSGQLGLADALPNEQLTAIDKLAVRQGHHIRLRDNPPLKG
jgi:hypothetical protein